MISQQAVQLARIYAISVTTEAHFRIMCLTSLGNNVCDHRRVEVSLT